MTRRPTVEGRFADAMDSALKRLRAIRKAGGKPRIGLAVSGGSDSIALMRLAHGACARLGFTPVVLCFDHAIDGENSAAESAFVRRAATRLGMETFTARANPPVKAGNGLSIEMAARNARRGFFANAAQARSLDAIATGHQRDDAAEGLLLRLLRGAGAAGLSGLRPFSPAAGTIPPIIRPLLGCGREELRSWLRRRRIRWMEDVANSNEDIPRCRVRLRLIPEIARAMARPEEEISASLAQSAEILRDEDDLLEALAVGQKPAQDTSTSSADQPLDLTSAKAQHPALARRIVRQWLMDGAGAEAAGFACVEAILGAEPGDAVNLPGGAVADIDRSLRATIREPALAPPPAKPLAIPGTTRWGRFSISTEIVQRVERRREKPGAFPTSCTISLCAVEAEGGLFVRGRAVGESFEPFGLKGTRKLQDIFVDLKVPARLRDSWPIVATSSGAAWIPGYRVAAPFAVPSGGKAIRITIEEVPE